MSEESVILLPGLNKQYKTLSENIDLREMKILVIGAASEIIAKRLHKRTGNDIEMIVPNFDTLMNARILLDKESGVNVKLMDFEHTDYSDSEFDIVYAQASVSISTRKGIIKETKRILKSGGVLCIGEIIALDKNLPRFILDIFESAGLDPLTTEQIDSFYKTRNFSIKVRQNFNDSLSNYYSTNLQKLSETRGGLSESEKSYYKKLLNQISHESKVFLNQGGDKYIGFEVLILEKN